MLYGLAGSIDQIVVVGILRTDDTINVGLTFNGMELAIADYQFQLINKLGALQIVKSCNSTYLSLNSLSITVSHLPLGFFYST